MTQPKLDLNEIATDELRNQLEFYEPIHRNEIHFETIEESKSVMPQMVIVSALDNIKVGLTNFPGGNGLVLEKGNEYVLSAPLYFSLIGANATVRQVLIPAKKTFKKRFRRYNGESLDNKSLLVWRYGGLGDLMFAQPLLRFLKSTYPTCKICFATAPPNVELLKTWPLGIIDSFAAQPFKANLMDNYDYHLTFEGSVERAKEAESINAYEVFQQVANVPFDLNEWQPVLESQPFIKARYQAFIPENTVVLQLKSTSPLRTYPLQRTKELVSALNDRGYVAGIIERRQYAFAIQDYLVEHGLGPDKAINLALFSNSVQQCVNIVDCCAGAIGVDSAIVHFAAALKKPVLGIYGPFPGRIRMEYYPTGEYIEAPPAWNECGIRPCCFHQDDVVNCPYLAQNKAPGCVDVLDPKEIVERFHTLCQKNNA